MAMPQTQLQPVEQQRPAQPYIAQVAVTPEQALQAYRALKEITAKVLQKGTDYDVIPGTPKPSLLKSGAENLLRFYGLGHLVVKTNAIEDWERGFFHYEFKVTVHKTFDDGREFVLSECYGSANTKEKRYRNQDPFMLVNTVQKMAIKRALVGAALQATGASGLFTQDIEDLDFVDTHEPAHRQQSQKQQRNGNGRQTNGNGQATEQQVKAIYAIAKNKGLADEEISALVNGLYNVPTPKELTRQQASQLIESLQQQADDELKMLAQQYMGMDEQESFEEIFDEVK